MRKVSLVALALLGVAALGAIPDVLTCGPSAIGECGNNLLWSALLFLLGLIGCLLALIASGRGVVRAILQRQWVWALGLLFGVVVPLPAGFVLSQPLSQAYGSTALPPLLPVAAGLLLTPVTVLIYGVRYPHPAAPGSLPSP
jgi:hypothetical protein